MSQAAKAQEPSMEEILASIRRIIADDDASKPTKTSEQPVLAPPAAVAPAPQPPPANSQSDVDAVLAELEAAQPEPKAEPPKPAQSKPPQSKSTPGGEVLDLTEAMTASPPPPPSPNFRTIDGTDDVVFTDRALEKPAAMEPPPAPEPPPRPYTQPRIDSGLLSNSTAAAVDSAFNTLASTVLGQNARTLEDLVKEMLKPMLKTWLDDNLPGLVERIVRAEIERVSRGKP
jgi:uncharacterized protein